MVHELWDDSEDEGRWTFCLAGPMGNGARSLLGANARLIWTVDAASHAEAMTRYHEHMGWGEYTTDFPEIDGERYADRGWS